jgi:tetratricopeptide (TPR) repeat protein
MSASSSDRNLLYGILALQVNFINRDALIRGMNAWVLEKHRPVGKILVEQGALRQDQHAALEEIVRLHLETHDNDAEKSLKALRSSASVGNPLDEVADADVQASLAALAEPPQTLDAAWREPPAVRSGRWVRKYRVLAAALVVALVLGSAGAVFWQQQRQQRLARIERQERAAGRAEAAIEQAAQLRKRMRWNEAGLLLAQASDAVQEAEDDALLEHHRQAKADLDLAQQLDQVREQAHALVDGNWQPTRVRDRYEAVFKRHGLEMLQGPVEALAERVRASPVRAEVLAALDDWTAHVADERAQRRLLELAWRVDPTSQWRKYLLEPGALRDRKRLLAVLAEAKGESLSPGTAMFLGLLLGLGTAEGRELLEGACDRHRDDFWLNFELATEWVKLAGDHKSERSRTKREEAIGYLRAALAVKPTSSVAYNNLGIALKGRGDVEGAIRSYREGICLDPRYAPAHTNLGNALRAHGDLEGAIRNYGEAIRLDPRYASAHNNLGIALDATGDVEGAIRSYREAIRLDPRYAGAHYALGIGLQARGDVEGAIRSYREAIRLDPKYAGALTNLGNSLHDKGDVEGAIRSYQEAIRLDPRDARAHSNLGAALAAKKNVEGAIRSLRKGIHLDPTDARAHYNLGAALHDKGDLEGAIRSVREAIRLDPQFSPAHYNLGNALKARGDLEGAVRSYREAVRLDPRDVKAHINLGTVLQARGDVEGAIHSYREAIRLDPKFAVAHTNLGNALHARGDVEGAIRSHREAIRVDPTLAVAHINLGVTLKARGDVEGAIRSFREAIRLDPKQPNAHAGLGLALVSCGDFASAQTSFQEAAKLVPATHPLARPINGQLARCRTLLSQERALNAVLAGNHIPKNSAERIELAGIAVLPAKQFYATAARLYTEALQLAPALASDLRAGHRYDAACAAARAGTSQGKDAGTLDATQRAQMRYRALCWLQDELTEHTGALARSLAIWGKPSYQALLHWKKDADLATVRDTAKLIKLPEAEQVAWRILWAQVDALLARVKPRK